VPETGTQGFPATEPATGAAVDGVVVEGLLESSLVLLTINAMMVPKANTMTSAKIPTRTQGLVWLDGDALRF
jgi:hypothetical protein